jgi:hypothetical protein
MSVSRRNLIGYTGLAGLAVVTAFVTQHVTSRVKAASPPPRVVNFPALDDEGLALDAEMRRNREESRRPYTEYWEMVGFEDAGNLGQLGLLVDVECWKGANMVNLPSGDDGLIGLRVFVYPPGSRHQKAEPVASWLSPMVPLGAGLYQERVPVKIPLPPMPEPYEVTVEVVSGPPVMHTPIGSSEPRLDLKGRSGHRFRYTVQ